jgi:hypothetical protein
MMADPWFFNRLATIAHICALNRPEQVPVRCGYITRLLAFVSEYSVFDLFEGILRKDDEMARMLQPHLDPPAFVVGCDLLLNLFVAYNAGVFAFHESALKLISQGIKYSEAPRARITEVNFFFTLASYVSACSTHGICHAAILKLIQGNMNLPIEFRTFSWQTIKMIYDVQPLVMEQIEGDARTEIEKLHSVVNTPYGGTVPSDTAISDQALAAFLSALSKR